MYCHLLVVPQAKDYKYIGSQLQAGGIVIRDMEAEGAAAPVVGKGKGKVGEVDRQMEADMELARQLQANLDAETHNAGYVYLGGTGSVHLSSTAKPFRC